MIFILNEQWMPRGGSRIHRPFGSGMRFCQNFRKPHEIKKDLFPRGLIWALPRSPVMSVFIVQGSEYL